MKAIYVHWMSELHILGNGNLVHCQLQSENLAHQMTNMFIGDEYFELMFEYVSQEHYIDETNNKEIYRYRYNLKENLYLTKRLDKKEIIQLIAKLKCFYLNSTRNKMGEFFMEDIVYEEEEYRWMH